MSNLFTINSPLFILLLMSAIFIALIFYRNKTKFNRHTHNIKKAKQVQTTLSNFENDQYVFAKQLTYLRKIDPFVFEELILNAYQQKGVKVIRNKRYTGDGGIDGKIIINGKLILIQAKRYKSYIAKHQILEFVDVVKKNNSDGGYFIHTGKTSANNFNLVKEINTANNLNIKVISGEKLLSLILLKNTN
jgi:restriction system protein